VSVFVIYMCMCDMCVVRYLLLGMLVVIGCGVGVENLHVKMSRCQCVCLC